MTTKNEVKSESPESPKELRRSSRSTKGKHSRFEKEDEITESPLARKPKTPRQKRDKVEEKPKSDDEESAEDGIVECICGTTEDDGELMAECEKCLKWQHLQCMLGHNDQDAVPEHYYCSVCKPELYPDSQQLKQYAEKFLADKKKKEEAKKKRRGSRNRKSLSSASKETANKETASEIKAEQTAKSKSEEPQISKPTRNTRKRKSDAIEKPTSIEEPVESEAAETSRDDTPNDKTESTVTPESEETSSAPKKRRKEVCIFTVYLRSLNFKLTLYYRHPPELKQFMTFPTLFGNP